MNKTIGWITTLCICMLLYGCPYESNVPITKPNEKVSQKLIGLWNEEHYAIKITKLDEFTYTFRAKNKYTNEYEDSLAFYTSKINGTSFINLFTYSSTSSPDKYFLYKVEFKGRGQIRLYPLSDDIKEDFFESDSLKRFVGNNMNKPGFFEGPMLLSRIGK